MIYLDNASTTRVYNDIIHLKNCYDSEFYFNPSNSHSKSIEVKKVINASRKNISEYLGVDDKNIIFTSCGSESNNATIFSYAKNKTAKLITNNVEHASVYNCFNSLKSRGYNVVYTEGNRYAGVDVEKLLSQINSNTALVSFLHVNNETGYINDIEGISNKIRRLNKNCVIHVDGVQSFGKMYIDLQSTAIDAYSFSGHKIGASKGVGGLYLSSRIKNSFVPLIHGGGQEFNMRSGTENVSGIVGMSKALELTLKSKTDYKAIKNKCIEILNENNIDYVLNSPLDLTIGNILNISLANVKAEVLQNILSDDDIIIGIGSACSSNSKSDRISKTFSLNNIHQEGTIRLSFFNNDIDSVIEGLTKLCCAVKKFQKN